MVAASGTTWLILTTAHSAEDGRLQRHLQLIEGVGAKGSIIAVRSGSPVQRMLTAPVTVWCALKRARPDVVVLPDPELWLMGPLIARLLGVKSIIDVHEDYSAVARRREWIPRPLAAMVALVARTVEAIGRRSAVATVVAASDLARDGDVVLLNLPASIQDSEKPDSASPRMVYVGDVTADRGLWEMLETVADRPEFRLDVVGPVAESLLTEATRWLEDHDLTDRVQLHGRLSYKESWERAEGASVGLALLRSTPAYEAATPTKIWEYMARGIPVLSTPLPPAKRLLEMSEAGLTAATRGERADAVLTLFDAGAEFSAKGRSYIASRAGETAEAFRNLVSQLQFEDK